ncbi:MAG: DUF2252 family protein [Chloroflexota bacterium]
MKTELESVHTDSRAQNVIIELNSWNQAVDTQNRQVKYGKMALAPLVFYRGTNHLFWVDFAEDDRLSHFGNETTQTWLQGDLHAYNFGAYHNSKDEIVYGLNDFDETIFADYQYDLWRMAISIVLIARQNDDLSFSQQEKVIDSLSQSYLDTLKQYRKTKVARKRYATQHNTFGSLQTFLGSVGRNYTREAMLDRWAPEQRGARCFDLSRDKLQELTTKERKMVRKAVQMYRKTLEKRLSKNERDFKVKDVARRLLAGTGSLGTNRYYVLIKDNSFSQYHILDIKQQAKPTPYFYLGKPAQKAYDAQFENDAQRHTESYQALIRYADKYQGWLHLESGDADFPAGYYSVRERSPFKEAFPGEVLSTRTSFSSLAEQWATILATNHTRANKALPKAVHMLTDDQDEAFRNLVKGVAFGYADQVMTDWQYFVGALDLNAEEQTSPSFFVPSYRDMLPR